MLRRLSESRLARLGLFCSALAVLFGPGFDLKPLVVLTLLNLALQENFPFSHFPMYSSFSEETFYLYVTGDSDQPIPSLDVFQLSSAKIKKIFVTEVWQLSGQSPRKAAESVWREAGHRTLRLLAERTVAQTHLRLRVVRLTCEGGFIQEESCYLAELPLENSHP